MVINIGAAKSFKTPASWEITPDDRQTKIETFSGVHVFDNGIHAAGELITCSCIFDETNWNLVKGYWQGRTLVTVTDPDGDTLDGQRRVVVKNYGRDGLKKTPQYYTANLEFWGA